MPNIGRALSRFFGKRTLAKLGKKNCGQNVEIGKNILTKHIKLEAYSTIMNI